MPKFTKHVGKLSDGTKVVVVFRELPGDSTHALVVKTAQLNPELHDDLMRMVDGVGQTDKDFYQVASRTLLTNGGKALESLHVTGKLTKVLVSDVTMMPSPNTSISLTELNSQLNAMHPSKTTSRDMVGVERTQRKPNDPLDDKSIAEGLRRQALQYEAEATKLRKEANSLDPVRQARQTKSKNVSIQA